MIVVSDASPLISLTVIGHLELLKHLDEQVLIPEAVYHELTSSDAELPGASEVRALEWSICQPVQNEMVVRALQGELDHGEAAAIALAVERQADVILIDERRARTVAARLGLQVVGVLGVLGRADELSYTDPCGHYMSKCQKSLAQFLIARGNAAQLFQVVKESFDCFSHLVQIAIVVDHRRPVTLGRDDRDHGLPGQCGANVIAIIGLVHDGMGERMCGRPLNPHRVEDGTPMALALRQHQRDPVPFIDTAGMDCGGQAPATAAQSLCGLPAVFFNAPAACWCARTMVASIKRYRASWYSSSWRRSQSWRQRPRASQRRKRL